MSHSEVSPILFIHIYFHTTVDSQQAVANDLIKLSLITRNLISGIRSDDTAIAHF